MKTVSIALILLSAVTTAMASSEVVLVKPEPESQVVHVSPVWSPDGRSIVYVTLPCARGEVLDCKGTPRINIATLSFGAWKTRILMNDASAPVWSPDSKQIACHSGGIVIVNVATNKPRRISTDMPDKVCSPISWSPNGRYLLYTLSGIAGPREFVMDLKTGKNVGACVGEGGAWTNAGKLIAWQCGDAASVKLIDIASGSSRVLLKDSCTSGAFVPKGDAFAYLWLRPSPARGEGIYKVDLKSAKVSKCVALRSEEVIWSKDGRQFASVSKLIPTAGAEPEMNLYVGNAANWYFKVVSKGLLTPTAGTSAISWSPDGKSVACATIDGGIKIVKL